MHLEEALAYGHPHEHKRRRPLKTAMFVLLWCVLALAVIAIPVAASAWRMASEAQLGRSALTGAMTAAKGLDLPAAVSDLRDARTHLAAADRFGLVIAPFAILPFVGADISDARTLIRSSLETATALERVAALGNDVLDALSRAGGLDAKMPTVSGGVVAFFRLPPADRQAVLAKLDQVPADFSASVADIDQALAGFDSLSASNGQYLALTVDSLKPVVAELRDVRDRLASAGELAKLLPAISGYPEPKNYLILLQNNTELRPTGGFIGTLGTVTIAGAQARDLRAMDVYSLDSAPNAKLLPPPAPLAKYLSVNKWYLRDANWSPDFPVAAKQVMSAYAADGGTETFDGVVAIDPTLAADLLKIVGNITVGGSTFSPANITDEIEFQVEKGFSNKGLPVAQRKDILIALVGKVFERVMTLPSDRWQDVVTALVTALDGKHMLIASFDPAVAAFARERNWDGLVRQDPGDYLMAVDANLASLKTDSVISRSVNYSLHPSGSDLIATVNLKYSNRGSFSWKTTRYRTYTRVYVPAGSRLVSVTGNMLNDKVLDPKHSPGTVDTIDELGRRSFGTFISIEPGETRELVFTYKLPPSIVASVTSGTYRLLVQKQPGISAVPLTLSLDFGKRVARATPSENQSLWGDNLYNASSDLAVDRQFEVGF
jgi:hypothetical protein